jgi:murein DD-endopeptidase MepM/ murein hydrolase activator NlpD
VRPVDKKFKVTQVYGKTNKKLYKNGMHKGIDFGCPIGTPVIAMTDGVVTAFNWGPAFGHHVIVDHVAFADGTPGLWAGYMHLSKLKVKAGQKIKAGQIIGWSGQSGHVTGSHLHVEVQNNKGHWNATKSVDPQKWIDA